MSYNNNQNNQGPYRPSAGFNNNNNYCHQGNQETYNPNPNQSGYYQDMPASMPMPNFGNGNWGSNSMNYPSSQNQNQNQNYYQNNQFVNNQYNNPGQNYNSNQDSNYYGNNQQGNFHNNINNYGGNHQQGNQHYGNTGTYQQGNQNNSGNYQQSFNSNNNEQIIVGPFLKFSNVDLNSQQYYATVLIVTKSSQQQPTLELRIPNQRSKFISPIVLDTYRDNVFLRYSLEIPLAPHQLKIDYIINALTYSFFVQGYNQPWRWAFFSCNGFSNDVNKEGQFKAGGANPLWDDLLLQHQQEPFHAMIGGGDQLYCDDVFLGPALKSWLDIPSRKERDSVIFSSYVENEVMDYYFNNYCTWFSNGTFKRASSMIPYSMVIDDHDIFDGFGSYPERMMQSPYFQGIKKCAMRFFLLFQHHTSFQFSQRDGYFGKSSYSWHKNLGPTLSMIGIDNRSERTLDQCLSRESYDILMHKLYENTPRSCRHLVVVLGIPIIYPRLSDFEEVLGGLSTVQHKLNIHKLFHKTGAMSQMVNQFGQPELLDDLCDHWTASSHLREREEFIIKLQAFAKERSIRVTFISGDVHLAAAGYLSSSDSNIPVVSDFRHMSQIVSSAIVNVPPPDMVVIKLHANAREYRFDAFTNENMYNLFRTDVNGKSRNNQTKCYNRRNWCKVVQDPNNSNIYFSIQIENDSKNGTVPYTVTVMPLQC